MRVASGVAVGGSREWVQLLGMRTGTRDEVRARPGTGTC